MIAIRSTFSWWSLTKPAWVSKAAIFSQPSNAVASISNLILPYRLMIESTCGAICGKSSAFNCSGAVILNTLPETISIFKEA